MPAFLVPVESGLCVIPLEKAVVLIGREADCDVSLTQSRKVSRKHCCLAQVNEKIMARDLGSTNGIYLNGVRVKKECQIRLGDELMIGDLRFRLQADPKAQRSAKPSKEKKAKPLPVVNGVDEHFSTKPTPFPEHGDVDPGVSLEVPVLLPENRKGQSLHSKDSSSPKPSRNPPPEQSGPLVPFTPRRKSTSDDDDVIPLGSDSL